jgi:hypothetical protein
MRRITHVSRPPTLDLLGLAGAVNQLTSRLSTGRLTIVPGIVGELIAMPTAVETATYRIAAEALAMSPCTLKLAVADDGVGFDPAVADNGVGIRSMIEPARETGGSTVATAPGRGHDGARGTAHRTGRHERNGDLSSATEASVTCAHDRLRPAGLHEPRSGRHSRMSTGLALFVIVIGVAIGVVSCWIPQPARLPTRVIVAILIGLVLVDFAVGGLRRSTDGASQNAGATAPSIETSPPTTTTLITPPVSMPAAAPPPTAPVDPRPPTPNLLRSPPTRPGTPMTISASTSCGRQRTDTTSTER